MQQLDEQDWPDVYQLMKQQDFPAVPASYAEAKPVFREAKIYGWWDAAGDGLQVALVIGPPDEGLAFLDVVCAPDEHGRWATPGRLRALYRLAFGDGAGELSLRGLWVQPHSGRALKACVQAGFRPMVRPQPPIDGEPPVLLMTPSSKPPRYCRTSN